MSGSTDEGAAEARGARVAAWAVAVGALLAVFHPLLLGRAVLYRDLSMWIVPARATVREALARGALPAWTPWEALGFAVGADPLYATLYPLALLTLPLPLSVGTTAYLVLHVALGGAGLASLSRRLGASPAARAAGALAWMLSGLTCSEWSIGVRLVTMAWIPWLCAAAWDLAVALRAGRAVARVALRLAAVGAMMVLSGEVYVVLMAMIPAAALGATAFATSDAREMSAKSLRRSAMWLVAAGAIALLLSAPTWLPALRLLGTTARAGAMSSDAVDRWSLPPLLLADALVPRGLVMLWMVTGDRALRGLLGDNVFYFSLYAGATAVALAAHALRRRGAAVAWACLGLVALGVLLALGRATPLLGMLRAAVTPFAHMRTPQKFLLVAHTPFALLVALGAERALGRPSWRALAVPPALLALAVLAVRRALPGVVGAAFGASAATALAPLALLAAALFAARRWGARAAFLVPLAVAIDLGHSAWFVFGWEDPRRFEATPPLARLLHALRGNTARGPAPPRLWRSDRIRIGADGEFAGDVPTRVRAVLQPKTNFGTGVAVLPGYDAAIPRETDRLAEAGRVAALRLLSVDFALMTGPAPAGLTEVAAPREGLRVHRVDAPLARAFVAHAAVDDAPPPRLSHLLEEPVVTGRVITLPRADRGALPSQIAVDPSPCAIARWSPGDVTLACDARAAGVAVLVEQWSPGWSVAVDGRGARVLRVNRLMLGAAVPAGRHAVRLRFETPGGRSSLILAGAGIVAALAWAAWLRRSRSAA